MAATSSPENNQFGPRLRNCWRGRALGATIRFAQMSSISAGRREESLPNKRENPSSYWNFPDDITGWKKLLPYAVLLSITFALYGVTLYFNFVWDDRAYVVENGAIHRPLAESIAWAWKNTYFRQYA